MTRIENPFHLALNFIIALVWLANGLYCKMLHLVARHQLIVAKILGEEHSAGLTKTIGILEVLMFFWIISGIRSRICAVVQVLIIASMNIIEFILAPELLLFGRMNIVFALLFISLILFNEFLLKRSSVSAKSPL